MTDITLSLKKYWRVFLHKNKMCFIIAMIGIILISIFDLVFSLVMQEIIDIVSQGNLTGMVHMIKFSICLSIFYLLTYYIYSYTKNEFVRKATMNYKQAAFKKITKKSISSFNNESTSTYISALTNDISVIEANYISNIFSYVNLVLVFIGALGVLFYYHVGLTLLLLIISTTPLILSFMLGNRLVKAETNVSNKNTNFVTSIQSLLSGFTQIKSFHVEHQAEKIFYEQNKEVESARKSRNYLTQLMNMLGAFNAISTQMGIFLVGGYISITSGAISVGTVFLFLQLANFIIEPIQNIPLLITNRRSAKALLKKLIGNIEENIEDESGRFKDKLNEHLTLSNLSFAYGDKVVLNDINYQFDMNKAYAIVGASGSGKSTLLMLLQKGYANYTGSIMYDKDELREIKAESIYNFISSIQQNVFIFNDTLENNITMFQKVDAMTLKKVIKEANLEAFVQEKGLSFACGENGCLLSGGEKQRIAIARALIKEASIILIDEATSSLDAINSVSIMNTVLEIKDSLRIIITHRLDKAMLEGCDEILVMDQGMIVETGNFQTLISKKQLFYDMYQCKL